MEKRTITIRGKVQKVGLRYRILGIADKLGVCGVVENLDDGSVLLICEAEPQALDKMIQKIKATPEPVAIEDMSVETSPATGMTDFRILTNHVNEDIASAIRAQTAELYEFNQTLIRMNQMLINTEHTMRDMNKVLDKLNMVLDHTNQTWNNVKRYLVGDFGCVCAHIGKMDLPSSNDTPAS